MHCGYSTGTDAWAGHVTAKSCWRYNTGHLVGHEMQANDKIICECLRKQSHLTDAVVYKVEN